MTKSIDPSCPKCGAAIPEGAPQGLCPKCVLEGAATVPAATGAPVGGTPPPGVDEVAAHFPDLEVVELIGAGGMGAVYKARQPKLDRFVALKILSHDLAADPTFEERFNREARVLARLNHPNIVTVFDFGTAGPYCYLLMEFVDGVNLRQAMAAGGFAPADALSLVQDVCGALGFAHEEGILHRDIKPENVLIDSRGRVKIADFGIAKLIGKDERDDYTLTMRGAVLGSPQYMAPEQIETPGDVDQRADIYSLGVVFYELLTGELPIGRFAAPSEKSPMDPRIDEIVLRTLEKEREARFQSAGEVRTGVEAIATSRPEPAPAAAPAPAPVDPSAEPETAKFATASAVCTGLALVFAVVAFFALPLLVNNPMSDRKDFAIAMIISVLAVGVPALLGFIFGAKALGEIHRSGGRKLGTGSAMFGVLTAPVIYVFVLVGMILTFVLKAAGMGMGWPLYLAIVAAVAAPVALFALVRTVGSFAAGGSGRRISTSAVALIAASVGAVAVYMFAALPGSREEPGRYDDPGYDPHMGSSIEESGPRPVTRDEEGVATIDWQAGKPDINLGFEVEPGHVTTFELVRQVPSGGEEVMSLDWFALAPDDKALTGSIRLGTISSSIDNRGLRTDIGAVIQSGGTKRTLFYYATLWGNWNMQEVPGGSKNLYSVSVDALEGRTRVRPHEGPNPEQHSIDLAARLDERGIEFVERLTLRVITKPRPGPGKPFVLTEGRTGSGSPAHYIVELLKQQPPAEDPGTRTSDPGAPTVDWSKGDPEIDLNFVAPAGRVTIFALRNPWDPKNQGPDDWYVVAPQDEDFKGSLKIGTTGSSVLGGKKHTRYAAVLLNSKGEWVKDHTATILGEQELRLAPEYPVFEVDRPAVGEEIKGLKPQALSGTLDLTKPGVHTLIIGTHPGSDIDYDVQLLAWSIPHPDPKRAVEHPEGRIGSVTPPDFIDNTVAQHFKSLKKQGDEPEPYPVMSVGEVQGEIHARSGMWFDSRHRTIADGAKVFEREELLLKKDSIATVFLDPETPVQLGPQPGDAAFVVQDSSWWFVVPRSELKVRVDRLKAEGELRILLPYGGELSVRGPVSFGIAADGELQIDQSQPESEVEVGTPWNTKLTARGPATFELLRDGRLRVTKGEVERFDYSDDSTTAIKAGEEYAHPTPENPGEIDPGTEREIQSYIEISRRLAELLGKVTDEASAKDVQPGARRLVDLWAAKDRTMSDALDDKETSEPALLKHGAELEKQMVALESVYEKLRDHPEFSYPLEDVLAKIGEVMGIGLTDAPSPAPLGTATKEAIPAEPAPE